MTDTKIIIISRRWPQALWQKIQQSLGMAPKKAGYKIVNTYDLFKGKRDQKKM